MTPFARSTFALVFLWYAESRRCHETRAYALDEGLEHVARELGVVVNHQHIRKAVARAEAHVANDIHRVRGRRCRARGDGVYLSLQQVDVVLNHVEPIRCRRQAGDPV